MAGVVLMSVLGTTGTPSAERADLLVVFPGWACAAAAYSGTVDAAGLGADALYLPLFDDAQTLREWSAASACGARCVERRSIEQDELVDAAIRARFDPARHRLTLFGHSAGSMTARRAADRWSEHVHALVFFGGAFRESLQLPYRFFSILGGANLHSRDGSLQLAAILDYVREARGATDRFPDGAERAQRCARARAGARASRARMRMRVPRSLVRAAALSSCLR